MNEIFLIALLLLALFLAAMFVPEFFSSRWQKKQNEKFRQAVQNGYMTEAVQLIEKQSFEAGLNRIYIRCETENIPSCRVAERTGYKLEGTHKQMLLKNDRFRDVNCYAKLKNA